MASSHNLVKQLEHKILITFTYVRMRSSKNLSTSAQQNDQFADKNQLNGHTAKHGLPMLQQRNIMVTILKRQFGNGVK